MYLYVNRYCSGFHLLIHVRNVVIVILFAIQIPDTNCSLSQCLNKVFKFPDWLEIDSRMVLCHLPWPTLNPLAVFVQ